MDSDDERDQTIRPDTERPDVANDRTLDVDTSDGLSVLEAAAACGVSEKTIRRWIGGGRLAAVKLGGQYRIAPSELERARAGHPGPVTPAARVANDQTLDSTGHRTSTVTGHGVDHAAIVADIAPLAGVIERQHETIERQAQENRQLAEAAAVWQFRALQAEERLKALTAGDTETVQDVPPASSAPPGAAERADVTEEPATGVRAWWRRLFGGTR